jgi:hypothetical protein
MMRSFIMMLAEGSTVEYNELKKLSTLDFLSKFDNFTAIKQAEIKAAKQWQKKK